MASLLAKRISRFSPFYQHHPLPLLSPLLRLPLSTRSQSQQPKEEMPFIAQYLVSSFGFSPERALTVSISRGLTPIKSPDRPNEVVSFLKEIGFSDLQVRKIISFYPYLLRCSVDNTLKPTTRALMEAGITGELFIQLIRCNPQCLLMKSTLTLSRLQFWRKFVGDSDEVLLKLIKYNSLLIGFDFDKTIMPKISLLREYGLSDQQIVKLITSRCNVLGKNIDSLRWVLKQTEELGILGKSNLYSEGVRVVSRLTEKKLVSKFAFFNKMYGWSEEDFCSAFRKLPNFLKFSEENILQKMDFLIKKAGIEPRIIASQPRLLTCSREKTVIPRHTVLSTLLTKGLRRKGSLLSACVMSEERFLKRYVIPYEKDLPELVKSYAAARAGSS